MRIRFYLILLLVLIFAEQSKARSGVETRINGYAAPGFEAVKEAFVQNFKKRGELGAAVCVYYKGQKVVDLYGGYRNKTGDIWDVNTMVMCFSTTKGIAALTVAHAVSQGLFGYDDRIAQYWPEFAQNGKGEITLRQLLNHEAGLPVLNEPLTTAQIADTAYLGKVLARQTPVWQPGTKHGYHIVTWGFFLNEFFRRADPQHRTIGRYFHEEIAAPLKLDFYIGLPDSIPSGRVATIQPISPKQAILDFNNVPKGMRQQFMNKNSLLRQGITLPSDFNPNNRNMQHAEIPSANGIGTARAIAQLYQVFALGAKALSISPAVMQELKNDAIMPPSGWRDTVMGVDMYYHLGFIKPGPAYFYASDQQAFGMAGMGGSFAFCDPAHQLSFCYVMNRHKVNLNNDDREEALRKAVYSCIQKQQAK